MVLLVRDRALQHQRGCRCQQPGRCVDLRAQDDLSLWPKSSRDEIADFPEIRNTHIDIYLGFANTYPDSRAGGYILAGKPPAGIPNGAAIGPCLNYGTALAKPGPIEKPKTISRPAKVDCTSPSAP